MFFNGITVKCHFCFEIVTLYHWLLDPSVSVLLSVKTEERGRQGRKKEKKKETFLTSMCCLNYVYLKRKGNMTQESKINLMLLILNWQVQVGIHSTLQKYFPTVNKLLIFCSYFGLNGHLLIRKCSMTSVLIACVNTSYLQTIKYKLCIIIHLVSANL